MKRTLYSLCILLLSALYVTGVYAGEKSNVLSAQIEAAHHAGKHFIPVSLFVPATGKMHTGLLKDETLLRPEAGATAALFAQKPEAVSFRIKDHNGHEYVLDMLRSHPFADHANTGYIDASGRHKADFDHGLHYQGALAGDGQSIASMSIFASGEIMILFANENGNFNIGRLEDGSGNYIFYNDHDAVSRPATACGTDERYELPGHSHTASKTTSVYLCNKVQVYWECDYQLFIFKGSLVNTQNYMSGLFNQFQTMYRNENIAMELKSIYFWTTNDGYPLTSSNASLDLFKAYWNTMDNAFDGDIAHFVTRDNHGNGGLGYVDVLCNKQYAYSYSDINGSYQAVPTFSWDVEVITHETGHNLGSKHTQWCGWNTGSGGTCGAIDNCYTLENGSGCTTCPTQYTYTTPGFKGTVMSYCHLVSAGINLALGFGPLPGAVIRDNVNSSTCLQNLISAKLTPGNICNSDGLISLSYNSNNFGTAPYVYAWSNGDTAQNLTGIANPGAYTVSITDSNGCSNSYTAAVDFFAKPGNGAPVTHDMPICCASTANILTLSATAPQHMHPCQTVAWLRTTAPLTTYAAAQAAFAAAQPAEISFSTNSTGISPVTGATLEIKPPASCTGPITFYFTPFISRQIKAANAVTSSNTNVGNVMRNGTQIGNYTLLADQNSLATACDIADTPATQTLTLDISGYTGRANFMTVLIWNAAGEIIYRQAGMAGNGTYTIPLSGIPGGALQEMKIDVFDFNCTAPNTCNTTQATISAVRDVEYAAITQPVMDNGCEVGTSIRVDYAPANCTPLNIQNVSGTNAAVSLYPNPGNSFITLSYQAVNSGSLSVKTTDVTGKRIFSSEMMYRSGRNEMKIDVRGWAKGVYMIYISTGSNKTDVRKLIVE